MGHSLGILASSDQRRTSRSWVQPMNCLPRTMLASTGAPRWGSCSDRLGGHGGVRLAGHPQPAKSRQFSAPGACREIGRSGRVLRPGNGVDRHGSPDVAWMGSRRIDGEPSDSRRCRSRNSEWSSDGVECALGEAGRRGGLGTGDYCAGCLCDSGDASRCDQLTLVRLPP